MSYKKVKHTNSWGSEEFHVGRTRINRPCTASVQWPDGTVSVERVHMRPKSCEVYDMGHSFVANSLIPYIVSDIRGLRVEVDLPHLRVDEQSIQWEK